MCFRPVGRLLLCHSLQPMIIRRDLLSLVQYIRCNVDNGAPFGDAFDMGDDPTMVDQYGFDQSQDRPPNGTHGGGGGSNWPLSGETALHLRHVHTL